MILIGLVLEVPVGLLLFCFKDEYALQKESDAVNSTADLKSDEELAGVWLVCANSDQ